MASRTALTLSVIVPNYNHAKYLNACLSAIIKQSFQPIEVLVLDDASTDNSVEVIQQFAARHPLVRLIRNETNLGVMPNLNKGVALARGEYVFIASADDEVLPGIFEHSLKLLAQYPQAGLSSTISVWRYMESGLSWHMAAGMSDEAAYLSAKDLIAIGKRGKLLISSNTAVFRKSALENVGLFHPDLRWHADWFAMTTCAFRYGLCFIPHLLGIINILPKSLYTAGRRTQEHRQVLVKILERLNSTEYADVAPLIRSSGALATFAGPMFWILLSRKAFWRFITPAYMRWMLWRSAELIGRDILPKWVAQMVLNKFYAAKQKPSVPEASSSTCGCN